jgi:hypothetical protein
MRTDAPANIAVMAGLDPAIHALPALIAKNVDARHKAGHDDNMKMLAS